MAASKLQRYAVIGYPVQHSLSPTIHQYFAEHTDIQIDMLKIESPLDSFSHVVTDFFDQGGAGCNVTMPFKTEAFRLATIHSTDARIAQAVNCLTPERNQSGTLVNIRGDNFDGRGFIRDLQNLQHDAICGRNILILGAGGAVRGILGPLLDQSPHKVVIANRTTDKAIKLASEYTPLSKGAVIGVGLDGIPQQPFDCIIHATTLGYTTGYTPYMHALSPKIIHAHSFCYDLSYGAAAQPFMQWSRDLGARSIYDGYGMLVEQAAATFTRWHNVIIPSSIVRHLCATRK